MENKPFARVIEAPEYGDNMLLVLGVPAGQFEDRKDAEEAARKIEPLVKARVEEAVAAKDVEIETLKATIAAMREAVLEFEHRPPDYPRVFVAYDGNGKPYALSPDHVEGFFKALDERWKSPDVKRWSEMFRKARITAESLPFAVKEAVAAEMERCCKAIQDACGPCGGAGCTTESGHDCDGTEASCQKNCPVPVPVPCEFCGRPIDAIRSRSTSSGKGAISDGMGNEWSKTCAMCGKDTMEVVRPGKVQCSKCG